MINRRTLMAFAAAFAVLFMILGISNAETVNSTQDIQNSIKIKKYIYSRAMLYDLSRLGYLEDQKLGIQTGCQSKTQTEAIYCEVIKPIELPEGKQHPTQGVWMIRYQFTRCSDTKIYNGLFIAKNNGEPPILRSFYPGSFLGNPALILDTMKMATAMAFTSPAAPKDCQNPDKNSVVFDIRATDLPHDVVEGNKTFKNVWNEIWTFKICDQMVDVAIRFTPDPNGNGIHFDCNWVKPEAPTEVKP